MNDAGESGVSQRESLEHVIKTTPEDSKAYKSAKAQLDAEPEIPFCLQHIWQWFWELHQTRAQGMDGPMPITFEEIQSWNFLKGIGITDLETDILKRFDSVYIQYVDKKNKEKRKKQCSSTNSKTAKPHART